MTIPFIKMHGLGNDYVYIDCISNPDLPCEDIVSAISKISKRHFGIGSDGVIFIEASQKADAKMSMYNADASQSEMCGNGLRCVMGYCLDHLVSKDVISVETDAGIATGQRLIQNQIKVQMFAPPTITSDSEEIRMDAYTLIYSRVDVGNPHAVFACDDVSAIDLHVWGPRIENDTQRFPERVNVEFYQEINPGHVKMRVWERGTGQTLACGTGAAAVSAVYRKQKQHDHIRVSLAGGDLLFDFQQDQFFMTGPYCEVAQGSFELRRFV